MVLTRPFRGPVLVFLALAVSATSQAAPATPRICNNSPALCSRPYDKILHLGAHDSPFLRDSSNSYSSFGNQYFNTTTQLDAGVRLLSAQIHVWKNRVTKARELHVCHTTCSLFDAGPLSSWLWEIRTWLDRNLTDVATLILVNGENVEATEIEAAYSQADIAHYGFVPANVTSPPPASNETFNTWPTLDTMIDRDHRLVTFVQPLKADKDNAPYLLDEFTFIWENNYAVTAPNNFTCAPDRPSGLNLTTASSSGRLSLLNHFLDWQQAFGIQVPDVRNIYDTNSWNGPGGLGTHLVDCVGAYKRQPTFVLVDFFNVGDTFMSVDRFNKVSRPLGRLNVSSEVIGADRQLVKGFVVSEAGRTGMRDGFAMILGLMAVLLVGS